MSPFVLFTQIAHRLSKLYPDLETSRYLSAPSLEYKGRTFACCSSEGWLSIKLDDETDLAQWGVKSQKSDGVAFNFNHGKWIQVPFYFHLDWENITQLAYDKAKEEYG